jgi:signal transduction histidine kinase
MDACSAKIHDELNLDDCRQDGFGILGMRERAHILGGEVFIHGVAGQGTTVTVPISLSWIKREE